VDEVLNVPVGADQDGRLSAYLARVSMRELCRTVQDAQDLVPTALHIRRASRIGSLELVHAEVVHVIEAFDANVGELNVISERVEVQPLPSEPYPPPGVLPQLVVRIGSAHNGTKNC
jgi:hypothetical protein